MRTLQDGYQIPFDFDISKVRCAGKPREIVARYSQEQITAILTEIASGRLKKLRVQLHQDCFLFSLETGLRRSELLRIVFQDYDKERKILKTTKDKEWQRALRCFNTGSPDHHG